MRQIFKDKTAISKFVIWLVYLSGIPFICYLGTQELFASATPFTLLLSAVLLLWHHEDWNRSFLFFALIAFSTGMLAEILGVATGMVFGDYHYGKVLGPMMMGVPWVIGLNWFLCVYAANSLLIDRLSAKQIIFLAPLLLVILDVLIEPVAMRLGFWHWGGDVVPMQNYLAWYVIAFFLSFVFQQLPFNKKNAFSATVYTAMFVFFLLVGIGLRLSPIFAS